MPEKLAAIPQAGLTQRDKDIALAVELVLRGENYRAAEDRTGIPIATIHRYVRLDSRYLKPAEREAVLAKAKRQSAAIVDLATEKIIDRLADEDAEISNGELNFFGGTFMDKLIKLDQIEKPEKNSAGDLLERLLENGGAIEVKVQANSDAIDVTPEPEEPER